MKLLKDDLKILGLTLKETQILDALIIGKNTPLSISRYTKISRPTIYDTFERFKERGLIQTNIKNSRKYWSLVKNEELIVKLYNTRKQLLNIPEGTEEAHGLKDATVVIHKGKPAIQKIIFDIIENHKEERLYAIQGNESASGWDKVIGAEKLNKFNRLIKENTIITEGVLPFGWFEKQLEFFGKKWAIDFEGRATMAHEIDEKYFQNAGQVWVFRKSLYLIAMQEEIIIEVRNSEIQKLILSMFRFIQDHSQKFDLNARLRELLKEKS
jgi:hypothetical protein